MCHYLLGPSLGTRPNRNVHIDRLPMTTGDEGVFIVLEIFFKEQVQFKMFIHRIVENFMGY
jgi:hypothetical protein